MSQYINRLSRLLLSALVAAVALGSQLVAALEVGDQAPDFSRKPTDLAAPAAGTPPPTPPCTKPSAPRISSPRKVESPALLHKASAAGWD